MKLKYMWIIILLLFFSAQVAAQSYQSAADSSAAVPVGERADQPTKPDIAIPESAYTEDLLRIKTALDREYAALTREAEALNSMAGIPLTEQEFEAYQEMVKQFNERRADYEKRVDEFRQQIQALHLQQTRDDETFVKTEKQNAATAESLNRAKTELDKEYSDLMKEREAIASACNNPATTESYEACKQKVADFNNRKADYEKRAKAFEEEAKAYNQSLK